MSDYDRTKEYFTRTAGGFDSLYAEDRTNGVMRAINRVFRRDMYVRFLMTLEHVRAVSAQSVFDVRCGSGRNLQAFVEMGVPRIVGVDTSPTMLALAAENLRGDDENSRRVELVPADFMGHDLDASFEVVVGMGFFDYFADPLPLLQEIRGAAAHSVIASFPSVSIYRTPIRKVRYVFKRCPVYFYTGARIRALASNVEASHVDVHKIRGSGQDYFVTLRV